MTAPDGAMVVTNPLIVQSDLTVLLEVAALLAAAARAELARFAELETAPEHVHTYRITPLSLWNAAVAGLSGAGAPATAAATLAVAASNAVGTSPFSAFLSQPAAALQGQGASVSVGIGQR
jgi:hypothetical protein